MKLEDLINEGNNFKAYVKKWDWGSYIDHPDYSNWKRKSLMFLQTNFPNHPQTKNYEENISSDQPSDLASFIAILNAFNEIEQPSTSKNDIQNLENIFYSFQKISNQLKRRYSKRETLIINDEYDVQDLLHSLLHLYFEDIRNEDWVPEYAGGKSRVDFLLKNEKMIIEVKMASENLQDKDIGDQLIIDVAHYKSHPDCKKIICFVFDPKICINNPTGLKNDLERLSENGGVEVRIFIQPQ